MLKKIVDFSHVNRLCLILTLQKRYMNVLHIRRRPLASSSWNKNVASKCRSSATAHDADSSSFSSYLETLSECDLESEVKMGP